MCQTLNRINVLVVDDDKAHADAVYELISEQNIYKVFIANNCDEALDLFCPNKFSIAFIDLNIDGKIDNGIYLISNIRAKDENIFIVVISAYPDAIYNKKLVESVNDFVKKPIDTDFFLSKLFLWTTKYESRARLVRHIDAKCQYIETKISDYESRLDSIKQIDYQIEELTQRISRYHPMENYGEAT